MSQKKKLKIRPAPTGDVRLAAASMSRKEAQFLVEDFFRWQSVSQATKAHVRILEKLMQQKSVVARFIRGDAEAIRRHETELLGLWAENFPAARWLRRHHGFGPLIVAGFAAFIDIDRVKTISSIWKHAGFTPSSRPPLRREADALIEETVGLYGDEVITDKHLHYISNKIGRDFKKFKRFCYHGNVITWDRLRKAITFPQYNVTLKKVCNATTYNLIQYKKKNFYGGLYDLRMDKERARNEAGLNAAKAKEQLERFDYNPKKSAYQAYIEGKLPDSHLRARAKRWAIKILLAHYYMVEYYMRYDCYPPDVYALDILKLQTKIHIPKFEEEQS